MNINFPITGTFIDEITYDIPSSNWSLNQWRAELDYMQDVGMDTLVFIRGGFNGRTIFPSKHFFCLRKYDFMDFILQETEKRNMKVFIGMYISNLTWNDGDYREELRTNKLFVDEVLEKYAHYKSFYGWYIPHETCTNIYNVGRVLKDLTALCKDKTPEKKTLVSPFFCSKVVSEKPFSPQRFFDEWDNVYESLNHNLDICAYQDGTAPIEEFEFYLKQAKELCDKHKLTLWTNVEGFERDPRFMYYPIPFELLQSKLEISQKYVEKSIMFEFSHFLSPQSIYPSARNLNALYKEYYASKRK